MYKIQPEELIRLQQTLRRGTIVKVHDEKKDEFIEAIFEGFSDFECPYRYCELHIKNPGRKKDTKGCEGYMQWILDDKEVESCPYLGGLQLTVGDQQVIAEIKTKKKNPETGISEEIWLEPQKYLK